MTDTPTYKPGDIANGHILDANGTWVPMGNQPAPIEAPKKKRGRTAKIVGLGIAAVVGIVIATNAGGSDDGKTYAEQQVADGGTHAKADSNAGDKAGSKPAEPEYTTSQEQAIASAQDYLDFSAFSKAGLVQQLSSKAGEGFPHKDAVFAVNHIDVDWNQQAVASAKNYLSFSAFSKQGLIEQLESKAGDGFTHTQAVYGANHAYK